MPQRWVLPCVAEIPEVVINSVLVQVHVPVLVDASVARWRLQLAGRLALASTVSIGDSPKAPAPRSSGLWRGAGGSFAGLSREVRGCQATCKSAPAGDGTVAPHPAGVAPSGADGDEGTRRRRDRAESIVAPAGDGAVALHPAGGFQPGADGDEGTRGRRDPAVSTVAPAGDGAVAPHPAGVVLSGVDGNEGTRGRRGPAIRIAAPAGDGEVTSIGV